VIDATAMPEGTRFAGAPEYAGWRLRETDLWLDRNNTATASIGLVHRTVAALVSSPGTSVTAGGAARQIVAVAAGRSPRATCSKELVLDRLPEICARFMLAVDSPSA
jgi:hypothetical protein